MIRSDDDPVVATEGVDETEYEYAERVRRLIREGIESASREPTVSPEDAKRHLFAVIARVAEQSRVNRFTGPCKE